MRKSTKINHSCWDKNEKFVLILTKQYLSLIDLQANEILTNIHPSNGKFQEIFTIQLNPVYGNLFFLLESSGPFFVFDLNQ
jgi:hypothetical protein